MCLQCSDWSCPNPYIILTLAHPAFPSFYPLRSQGGHNGGVQAPFSLISPSEEVILTAVRETAL
jgi:hypothetical protein